MSDLERNPARLGSDRPSGDNGDPILGRRSHISPLGKSERLPRASGYGSWDYNPAYPAMEMGQKLDDLEQEASQISQQRRELAAQELAARVQLEAAGGPERDRLQEQLDGIEARLTTTGQELEAIGHRMSGLKAELNQLCQEIRNLSPPAAEPESMPRAA